MIKAKSFFVPSFVGAQTAKFFVVATVNQTQAFSATKNQINKVTWTSETEMDKFPKKDS